MTDSGFEFDERTKEIRRHGLVRTLTEPQSRLFAIHWRLRYRGLLTRDEVNKHLSKPLSVIEFKSEYQSLNYALKKLGASIKGDKASGRCPGRRFVVGAMPKWQPSIPPVHDELQP